MAGHQEIFDEKRRFIAQITQQLEANVGDMSKQFWKLLLTKFVDELDRDGDQILNNTRNIGLIAVIDNLWKQFQGQKGGALAQTIARNVKKISQYNIDYFGSMGLDEAAVPAAAEQIQQVISDRLGTGDKTRLKPGGYMDSLIKDNSISTAIKNLSFQEVAKGTGFQGFKKALETFITGDENNLGRFRQYYRQYAYDIYVNVDRLEQTLFAKELDLKYFIYEGTIIETSREFCVKRAGKVFTEEEAKEWVNDPWIQKNLEKGYISSYNPTTDLGLFGCRHLPRYVSKAVAEYLRPDLKKVDPEANKKPKPAPEPPKKPEPAPEPKPKPAEGDSVTLTIEKTKTKPAGQSIKAQFTDIQKPLRETVQKALDLVAQVHGDGELKDIPFKLTKGRRFYGRITFLPSARGGYEANKIEINDSSVNEERSELTTIHELGHFLDMYSAGNKQNFGTRNGGGSKDLDQFLKVAGESKKIKALRALLLKGTLVDKDGKWFKMGADVRKFIRYTLKPEEIWARAYPQYIAYKTGDERLLRALQQKEGWMKQNGLQTQWDKEDFEEIGKEIEAFMIKKGWLSQ